MRKTIAVLTALILVAALFAGCGDSEQTPISVQSVSMLTGLGTVGVFDRFAGVVEAGESVNVQRDANMELDEILVRVGDPVTTGQTLFTYDTESISLELDKLQLELEQMKNSKTTKQDQIKELEAEKKKASADNQLSYTLQIQSLEVEIKETDFNIAAKQKSIDAARTTLADSAVVSPCDGTIKAVNTENVGYDEATGAAAGFIVITQSGEYRIKGTVNEQNRAMIVADMPVLIRSRADETTWSGTISLIDTDNPIQNNGDYWGPVSEETVSSTNYPFYVSLDSTDGLMIGQHVYIEPDFGQEEDKGFALPAYFVVTTEDEPFVWAADEDDELERRTITLGEYDSAADTYQVLEGLELSDYIADPNEPCESGAPVSRYDESSFGGDSSDMPAMNEGGEQGIDGDIPENVSPDASGDYENYDGSGDGMGDTGLDDGFIREEEYTPDESVAELQPVETGSVDAIDSLT